VSVMTIDHSERRKENKPPEVIYHPDSNLGYGWSVWVEMIRSFVGCWELTWQLFLRDLSARYRQSYLGYVWAVFPAIITTVAFTYLNNRKILPIGETDLPYPVYVLLGMAVWQLFATGVIRSTQSLVLAQSFVTKIYFPRESLVIAAAGQALLDFTIQLPLVIAVFMWFGIVPAWTIIFTPFLLIPLGLMTLGLGFLLALANGVIRDVGTAMTLLMSYTMFLTPVVYPPPTEWPTLLINYVNPVSPFVIAVRDLTTKGVLTHPYGLGLGCVSGVIIFLIGLRIFHLAMPRVMERV